jgi:zinc transporter ZupT
MTFKLAASLAVALLFAAVHVLGDRFRGFAGHPRSVWLSAAGGISVAYVFVHLLPDLAAHQESVLAGLDPQGTGATLERHVYLVALAGLALFYGIDAMLRRSARECAEHPPGIFWTHLAVFALYNFLIGYLLVHREDGGTAGLALFGLALGVHFLVNDQSLRAHHGHLFHDRGRWLLGLAPLAGWAAGAATEIAPLWLSALFALLAGSMVLNVLKEELPEEREGRFWAFAAGAAGYSLLLILAE